MAKVKYLGLLRQVTGLASETMAAASVGQVLERLAERDDRMNAEHARSRAHDRQCEGGRHPTVDIQWLVGDTAANAAGFVSSQVGSIVIR